ncbi:pI9R [African swine fever virus]|uniref:PI9R n=1 Tax=African swine fever virus TaxID=10497 RepID=A0A894KH30_ASF|nr:pI9R [African swine fever virus]
MINTSYMLLYKHLYFQPTQFYSYYECCRLYFIPLWFTIYRSIYTIYSWEPFQYLPLQKVSMLFVCIYKNQYMQITETYYEMCMLQKIYMWLCIDILLPIVIIIIINITNKHFHLRISMNIKFIYIAILWMDDLVQKKHGV